MASLRTTSILAAIVVVVCVAASPKTRYRSDPPSNFDKAVSSMFERDARSLLEGPRPEKFTVKKESQAKDTDSEVASEFDRSELMKNLRALEHALAETLRNTKSFAAGNATSKVSADAIEQIGRTLLSSDPDYSEDDSYLKQAEEMTAAAKQIKATVAKGDYEGAVTAFAGIKKSCDKCHQQFR